MEITEPKKIDIDTLLDSLSTECVILCKELQTIKSIECADGIFGKFMGSQAFRTAIHQGSDNRRHNKLIRNQLRHDLQQLYQTAWVWHHSINKPFGYPGDFAILELVYNNQAHQNTQTAIGQWIDKWAISTVLPRAVKARKNALRHYLESFIAQRKHLGVQNIMSIACGSAREIRELPKESLTNANFHLLDQDTKALDFVKSFMSSRPEKLQIDFIEADALKPFKLKSKCDLIYSFGLYDYLQDKYLDKSIKNSVGHLKEDGIFLFALKDYRFYPHWFYDWFYNWRFVSRTIEDGYEIAHRNGLSVTEVITVETGTINLFICKKE